MNVTFTRKEQLGKDIFQFFFAPERPLRYQAGQFVEIGLINPKSTDERGSKRWFTLASSPNDEELAIITRVPAAPSTFKQSLLKLRPGDRLRMSEAMGDFVLPKNRQRALVFIAVGIGVTPFKSMVDMLQSKNEERSVELLYAAAEEELLFLDEFKSYCKTTTISGRHLTVEDLLSSVSDLNLKQVYISGPERMVEQFVNDLQSVEVAIGSLVTDYFHGYKD